MDTHSILHTSEIILGTLIKKYGENRVHLNISTRDCEIPSTLKMEFETKSEIYQEKSA